VTFDLEHGLEVARRCPPDLWLAGLLHDAIEDRVVGADTLRRAGVPWRILHAVIQVTRWRHEESYETYIANIAPFPDGRAVKIADLEANLARMDKEHESLGPRYEKALARLKEWGA
jgi:hypothetical protein